MNEFPIKNFEKRANEFILQSLRIIHNENMGFLEKSVEKIANSRGLTKSKKKKISKLFKRHESDYLTCLNGLERIYLRDSSSERSLTEFELYRKKFIEGSEEILKKQGYKKW